MATEILRPGAVSVTAVNALKPSALVGPSPQWADSADASYATVWLSNRADGTGGRDNASATFDALSIAPELVTGVTLNVRVATSNLGSGTGRRLGFDLYLPSYDYVIAFFYARSAESEAPADALIHDLSYRLDATDYATFGTTAAAVASALTTGCLLQAFRYSGFGDPLPSDYSITVYEAEIVVDYDGTAPTRRRKGWQRHSQRGDGLGFSAAPRHVQNASVQASRRNFGIF